MERFLSTIEVVERLRDYGITTSESVRQLFLKRELPVQKVKKGRRSFYQFRECDVDEYIWARQGSRKLFEIPFF